MLPTLFLCILLLSLSAAEANHDYISPISTSEFQQKQAEEHIRDLNLFPKLNANTVEEDHAAADAAPRIVEKSFRFPYINANSIPLEDLGHHAGYYNLAHTNGARMFYFFFETRNKNASAPIVVWLSGGPGCSSSLALFFENGPFQLMKNSSLEWNQFGWDQAANIIYVDQPTGTGLSYSTSRDDLRRTSEEASVDFYDFLQAFFEKHPNLVKNDFYIIGESFAAHYLSTFAAQIQQRNKNKQGIHISLKGLAIQNGWANPEIQCSSYADYGLNMKLIDMAKYIYMRKGVTTFRKKAKFCATHNNSSACSEANEMCAGILMYILSAKPGINYYDIRKNCRGSMCYDLFSSVERFMNNKEVRKALGVDEKGQSFFSCSSTVHDLMAPAEIMKNFDGGFPTLLQEGVKVLIYSGEYDVIDNWLGNWGWVKNMQWSGRKRFLAAREVPFVVDRVKAGLWRSYGGLTFFKVFNAGHMVSMDQPKVSLEMLIRWFQSSFA